MSEDHKQYDTWVANTHMISVGDEKDQKTIIRPPTERIKESSILFSEEHDCYYIMSVVKVDRNIVKSRDKLLGAEVITCIEVDRSVVSKEILVAVDGKNQGACIRRSGEKSNNILPKLIEISENKDG